MTFLPSYVLVITLPFKKLVQNKQNKLKVVILNQLKIYTIIYLVAVGTKKIDFATN